MHIIKKIIYFLITIAVLIKIIFLSSLFLYYVSYQIDKSDKIKLTIDKKSILNFFKWKSRAEFLFQICIALLIIIIFNPWYNNLQYITKEITVMFFIFGIILIISADWNNFMVNIDLQTLADYS